MNHEKPVRPKREKWAWRLGILIALIFVAVITWLLFVYDFYRVHRRGGALTRHSFHSYFSEKPATANDATSIQPWMTFDYINKVFKLPATFLQNQFSITDTHYPIITLKKYAEAKNQNTSIFTGQVQEAVKSYLTSQH